MRDLLKLNYGIHATNKVRYQNIDGYQDDNYYYFIIPSKNKEIIHMEQSALAYYLSENLSHVAKPITSNTGEWFQQLDESTTYMIVRVNQIQQTPPNSHGKTLANFHEIGTSYQYEPQEISSYGQWKNLWINKLTAFEHKIKEEASNYPTKYYRLVMDMLPYLIGISENAIQYMQESESEQRYSVYDQGSIVFRRYHQQTIEPIIWPQDLVFDHPTRDLAELIRPFLFKKSREQLNHCQEIIKDYESIRPLSVFSWRLLYARLLFPIHLFDCLEEAFIHRQFDKHYRELTDLLHQQSTYERQLGQFFEIFEVDHQTFRIPVVHWL